MFGMAVKNFWAHKRRMIGTMVAIALGVAFLSGTLLLSDTLRTNFQRLFVQANGSTDVVVRGGTQIGTSEVRSVRSGVDASLAGTVSRVPGVARVEPYVEGFAKLTGKDGVAIGGNGPPTRAANWVPERSLNPYRLAEGRAPQADDEVVINRGASKTGKLSIGDSATLLTPIPVKVRIVGLTTFGTADGFGPSTFTGMTVHAAQQYLTTRPNQVSELLVQAQPGVSAPALAGRVKAALPAGVQITTGSEIASENNADINAGFLAVVRDALLVFALIALLVACFSIHNTFSVLAAQRGREVALMRALGATRRQVITAGVIETVMVGVLGTVVGWVVGVGLAQLLKAVFHGFGFALPTGGMVVKASSTLVALAAGMVATVVAGLIPAIRSSRVRPLSALRELAVDAEALPVRRVIIGVVIGMAGIGAVVAGATGSAGAGLAGLGAFLTIIGTVILGPAVARPVTSVLGTPVVASRGVTGALARQNAMRNPKRTAATASALMVGVTVVVLFTVVASSLKASVSQNVARSLTADVVIDAGGYVGRSGAGGLSPTLLTEVGKLPAVAMTTALQHGPALVEGFTQTVTAIDPGDVSQVLDLDVAAGSVARVGPSSLAISKDVAKQKGWRLGSPVTVTYPDGNATRLTVAAIYERTDLVGDYVLDSPTWTTHLAQTLEAQIFVRLRPGSDLRLAQASMVAAAKPFGAPRVQSRSQFQATAAAGVNNILGLVYVMLVLAIVIALMGIGNTISLSIHERRRELGLLRAVGQRRSQTRAMVRWESVIIAVFGTIGGVALGTFLGWAIVRALSSRRVLTAFSAPPVALVTFLVVGAGAGLLAGVRPARRAARLPVLEAIASQ
jgi:putative ABC transport system permease protein